MSTEEKKEEQPAPPPKIGPIVEDMTVVGGVTQTGAPRIVPRAPGGGVQEDVHPTDPGDA